MTRYLLWALLLGVVLTAASYAIDIGCSCGPARGLPFTFVHPYLSCSASSRIVIGARPEVDRFGPVLDLETLAYDVLLWSVVAFFVARHFRRKAAQPVAPPNGGPATSPANSAVGGGPPSVS